MHEDITYQLRIAVLRTDGSRISNEAASLAFLGIIVPAKSGGLDMEKWSSLLEGLGLPIQGTRRLLQGELSLSTAAMILGNGRKKMRAQGFSRGPLSPAVMPT